VCDAVEGRKLWSPDVRGLREEATRAEAEGAAAVFLADGPLGDPIVLAASLSASTTTLLLGVEISLAEEETPHRHPTILGRDMTTLDLLCGGRAILTFAPPFDGAVAEAIGLCRDMWVKGTATSEGPHYPVPGAVNRPQPASGHSPLIALDLSGPSTAEPEPAMVALVDLLLRATVEPSVCRMERPS
jgi:alkanesulfonate monooxygenase SsuD/methylene tetrahydromethanopterin reductase-like flavin-dependent oxidoreductase (luciferase family)